MKFLYACILLFGLLLIKEVLSGPYEDFFDGVVYGAFSYILFEYTS